ncbi:MFS transporter, putative metabolite:H+ symporter [Pseudomonas asplenii]|uniref:MFS transporter, putative metabolite:H+ symporter n=1 Tax=Pseudomonas asplenii TaxID=53407 RepID=A0A1H1X4M5_9PSED|nr:MFS transporter [Pseudomonas asplenii]SDT04287.1 MFS transporter, putative metabolite:H+ symporter [Pseudomonas asplenii]
MKHSELSIASRLDRLPVGRFHYRLIFMIGAGLFLDSFELALAGSVLGALLAEQWSTTQLNAWFISATFMGFIIGAWTSGILGDRIGRRYCYQINLAIFGLASLAAAFSPNMYVLIGLRFLMGIGLGGELVLGFATLSEFVPPAKRGRLVAFLSFIAQSALFVAGACALWVIPNLGWRWMFGIAGVAALIIWGLRKSMPESPRWLASKGRFDEADAIVSSVEKSMNVAPLAPSHPTGPAAAIETAAIGDLFQRGQRSKMVVGISIMITIQICLYGLVSWLPSFFVQQGLGIVKSLQWNTIMSFGGPVGGLIALLLVDRVGRKPILVCAAICAAVLAAVYVSLTDEATLIGVGFLLISSIYTVVVVGQAIYLSELFPTRLRMRGTGTCSAVARLVATMIPFAIPAIFAAGGIRLVIGIVGAVLLAFALIIAFVGKETRKQPLEHISS